MESLLDMTHDQATLFALICVVIVLLVWGRWRYDLVAFGALVVALILGAVPVEKAFSGFGHPATVIIALVLIISRGLSNAGVVEMVSEKLIDSGRRLTVHIGLMASVSGALSAIMNNVAALALLMPIDLRAASRAKRSPAITLMPLSFATILGGMITLIGTPPNIIIASFRQDAMGEPFGMFDFAPVGLACAVAGIAFVALLGWRLIPTARQEQNPTAQLFELSDYVAELKVREGSQVVDEFMAALDENAAEAEAEIIGLVRNGQRMPGFARRFKLQVDDVLVVQGGAEAIENLAGKLDLDPVDTERSGDNLAGDGEVELMEAVVQRGARAEGRSAASLNLLRGRGVALLGISRQGRSFRQRVRRLVMQGGDVLLLLGPRERLLDTVSWLGALPLAERGLQVIQRGKAWIAAGIFAAAIALASAGLVDLAIGLAAVTVLYALLNIVPVNQVYESIEWPVIVLLGSMIPIGEALADSGGTGLIAQALVDVSAGYPAVVALTLLMVVTMSLSDVINNTATAVIAAPIAIEAAQGLGANPDPFLMAVAVGSSCAFLTPIGHKNNTIIMGPGGYRFGDYWRMGLPLELLIIIVAIPMILLVWPL